MKLEQGQNAVNCCEPVPVPKMQMSDRLLLLMKEMDVTGKLLNDAMWNVCLERYERNEKITEPECIHQSIDVLENMVYWVQRMAEKLNNELR